MGMAFRVIDAAGKIFCVPRFYLNDHHRRHIEVSIAAQAKQPTMTHAKAAAQYNRIMKHAPTAIDPTKPIALPPQPE